MIDMLVPFYAKCPMCPKVVPCSSRDLGDVRPEDVDRHIGDLAARHSKLCNAARQNWKAAR